jgi:hypothetical protein
MARLVILTMAVMMVASVRAAECDMEAFSDALTSTQTDCVDSISVGCSAECKATLRGDRSPFSQDFPKWRTQKSKMLCKNVQGRT